MVGMHLSLPSFVYRPSLGPKIKTAAKAIHPPIACTTTDPAKSLKGAPNVDLKNPETQNYHSK